MNTLSADIRIFTYRWFHPTLIPIEEVRVLGYCDNLPFGIYLSYSSAVVIEHSDQGNL